MLNSLFINHREQYESRHARNQQKTSGETNKKKQSAAKVTLTDLLCSSLLFSNLSLFIYYLSLSWGQEKKGEKKKDARAGFSIQTVRTNTSRQTNNTRTTTNHNKERTYCKRKKDRPTDQKNRFRSLRPCMLLPSFFPTGDTNLQATTKNRRNKFAQCE